VKDPVDSASGYYILVTVDEFDNKIKPYSLAPTRRDRSPLDVTPAVDGEKKCFLLMAI